VWQYHRTSPFRSTSLPSARRAFTGSARFAESDDLLTLSRQRLLCTRSSRLVSTTATLFWLVRQIVTDRLQCVLDAAVFVVRQTRKLDRGLPRLLHKELHWLDAPERDQYKFGLTVHRCMQRKAPRHLADCCTLSSDIASRQCLRSASRRQLDVPHYRSKFNRRAFSVAGPVVWNSLPAHLHDPSLSSDSFKPALKTHLFTVYQWHQCIRGSA